MATGPLCSSRLGSIENSHCPQPNACCQNRRMASVPACAWAFGIICQPSSLKAAATHSYSALFQHSTSSWFCASMMSRTADSSGTCLMFVQAAIAIPRAKTSTRFMTPSNGSPSPLPA